MKTVRRIIAAVSLAVIIALTSYCVYTAKAYERQTEIEHEEVQSM